MTTDTPLSETAREVLSGIQRRNVLCALACAGVPDDALTEDVLGQALADVARLEAERGELAEALRELARHERDCRFCNAAYHVTEIHAADCPFALLAKHPEGADHDG